MVQQGRDIKRLEARVGTVLKGKWWLDRLIGVGAMAAVYRATHRNGNEVAIKMFHPELCDHPEAKRRFIREGYVANKVKHCGVVTVQDDDVADDGAPFLVMDLLEGESLGARRIRKGGKLPPDEVLSLVDQLLDTLAAAHEKGIVHRDIKPDNLFLTYGGMLKVLDFGVARLRELSKSDSAVTKAGALLGTPSYMAPEQARGRPEEVDWRSDLWAVGATMFTLLTGSRVHGARTATETLVATVTQRPRSIVDVDASMHPALVGLVDKALSYEKDERWPDARAMQDALRRVYHAIHASEGAPGPPLDIAGGGPSDTVDLPPELAPLDGRKTQPLPPIAAARVLARAADRDADSNDSSQPQSSASDARAPSPSRDLQVADPGIPTARSRWPLAVGGVVIGVAAVGLVAFLGTSESSPNATEPAADPGPAETTIAVTAPPEPDAAPVGDATSKQAQEGAKDAEAELAAVTDEDSEPQASEQLADQRPTSEPQPERANGAGTTSADDVDPYDDEVPVIATADASAPASADEPPDDPLSRRR